MSDTRTIFPAKKKSPWRWVRRLFALGCTGVVLLIVLLVVLAQLFLNRVPSHYAAMSRPIDPPAADEYAAMRLDGFESPYLGHTGSANGKGGMMFGGSKESDLDAEAAMGLRWTFLPVNWSAIERDRAVDLSQPNCFQAKQLDEFVIAAHQRKLNILLQIVIGGNAGGPPAWAGRRVAGKSAPADMTAAATFAGKLAARYSPGGVLAQREHWTNHFGVRAWELDNEPEGYRTCWNGQAGDYAEFATLSTAAIKNVDPQAMIALAATAGGGNATPWLTAALDGGKSRYRIGPVADIVSFHCYEGLETSFNRSDRTIVDDVTEVRDLFNRYRAESRPLTSEYWHTEGNFDFLGVLSARRRAAWRFQFMTRAFAAGIRKVCVMDSSREERAAVKAYISALPWPFPMTPADADIKVISGNAAAFRHIDGARVVWILWSVAGTGDAHVRIPVTQPRVAVVGVDGKETDLDADKTNHTITVNLIGDAKMAPGILVIDRSK